MRLKLKFGMNGTEETIHYWDKDVKDFHKLLRYKGKKWEWVVYNQDDHGYEMLYSEIPTYDPTFYVDMPSFEELFPGVESKCECGSHFSSFGWDHMRFCSKWRPW